MAAGDRHHPGRRHRLRSARTSSPRSSMRNDRQRAPRDRHLPRDRWHRAVVGGPHRRAPSAARHLSTASALTIGVSQAFALLPGISRSGATITAGPHARPHARGGRALQLPAGHADHPGGRLFGARKLFDDVADRDRMARGWHWLRRRRRERRVRAIGFLLAWLRTRTVIVFSVYRTRVRGAHRRRSSRSADKGW